MQKNTRFFLFGFVLLLAWVSMPQWAGAAGEDKLIERTKMLLPIGPIGVRVTLTSVTSAKVTTLDEGSPADGKLQMGDVIVGANGKKFAKEIWREMGQAVEASQGDPKRNGKFTLEVLRNDRPVTVEMKIDPLGRFRPTYPLNCPKSDRIYEMACDYLAGIQTPEGTWPHASGGAGAIYGTAVAGMALLGSGNPKYNDNIRKVAAFMLKQDVGPNAGGSSMWSLVYAGMFLSEYYLATGGDPIVQDHLQKIYTAIRYSQMAYGGRDGGSLDDAYGGPYYWNHAGQQTAHIGSYPHMGVMNANSILTYSLMQRCGIEIEPVNLNRTQSVIDASTIDGGVCYGYKVSAGDGFGRTGLTTIGYYLLGNRPDSLQRMSNWLSRSGVDNNIYFRSHYTPMIGQTWGLIGLYLTNPQAFHESMEHFKWNFVLNVHFKGGFCRCTNLYAYMYYHPSKKHDSRSAWIGGSEFQALFYALSKRNLALTGAKSHVMGVDRGKLPPQLAGAFGLMDRQQFEDAQKVTKGFLADRKAAGAAKVMLQYIENRAKMSEREIARLNRLGDVYKLSAKLKEHEKCFGNIGGYAAKNAALSRSLEAPKQVEQAAVGKELYGIVDQPYNTSQNNAIAKLRAFVKEHPQSPYAGKALAFLDRKRVAESIPENVISQMEEMKKSGDLYELSKRMNVYRPLFGTNPDYRRQIEAQWQLVSAHPGGVRVGQDWARVSQRLRFGKERATPEYKKYREKEITAFIKRHSHSPYVKLAKAELETTVLDWYRTKASDDSMIGLQSMTHLTGLTLSTTGVTNEAIKRLAPLTNLTQLDISDTRIRSGAVEYLKPFTKLTHLSMSAMGDSDMAALDKLGLKLVDLSLNQCRNLTDKGLAYVGRWKTIESLNLRATGVGDAGMACLTSLPLKKLILIRLRGRLTDAGLAQIGRMKTLEYLDLSFNTEFTDVGIARLAGLKNLKYLDLCGTNISSQAVQKLRKAIGNDALFVKKVN